MYIFVRYSKLLDINDRKKFYDPQYLRDKGDIYDLFNEPINSDVRQQYEYLIKDMIHNIRH